MNTPDPWNGEYDLPRPRLPFRRFKINGERRLCPWEWWEPLVGPKPPDDFDCNGCTASPDFWMGYAVWPACRIHDWHYSEAGPDIPRILADLTFRINIWRCVRAQGCPRYRAFYLAATYWSAVTVAGAGHFKGRWHRFKSWLGGLLLILLTLTACGGGGSRPAPSPRPAPTVELVRYSLDVDEFTSDVYYRYHLAFLEEVKRAKARGEKVLVVLREIPPDWTTGHFLWWFALLTSEFADLVEAWQFDLRSRAWEG